MQPTSFNRTSRYLSVTLLALTAASAFAGPGDWTQWRGSNRDGAVTGFTAPATWPEALHQVWKVEVGTGHATPLVADGRIYVFSRLDNGEVIECRRLTDAKSVWRRRYPVTYKMHPAARDHGQGPKSTPILHAGHLYTLGITGRLHCLDAATGDVKWSYDFTGKFRNNAPLFGTAASPIIDAGLLIAHVGGHDHGALTAFDARTGDVKWRWAEDGPGYTSPIVVTLGGRRQLVTQSQEFTLGLDPITGKLLWKIPYETQHVMNIVTPVLYKDTLIFGGYRKPVDAVEFAFTPGGTPLPRTRWSNPDLPLFMSSPVLIGDALYGFSQRDKGKLFCLDAATGKTHWTTDGRMGENAAIVHAGNTLFTLTDRAELIVSTAGTKKFDPRARYKVADSPTWAHPVVINNRILIKDKTHLTLWSFDK